MPIRTPDKQRFTVAQRGNQAWDLIKSPSAQVGLRRVGSDYEFLIHVGGQRWWATKLASVSYEGGVNVLHHLNTHRVLVPVVSVDDSAGSETGSWSTGTNVAAYGGAYRFSTTSGSTATWTSPALSTKVGLRAVLATNGGFAKVTLSGGATANLLLTAQQHVDLGTLASTALVANGGTLNPTDRLIDFYQGSTDYDFGVGIADELSPAAYTVTITATPYKQTDSSSNRTYVSGYTSATSSTNPQSASADMLQSKVLMTYSSAHEYAHYWKPTGGAYTFIGDVHGYEDQVGIGFMVDGWTRGLADGDEVYGSVVECVRETKLYHPDAGGGATVCADIVTRYTVDGSGMRVEWELTWRQAGTMGRCFPAMFPLDGVVFTRGSLSAAPKDYTLTGNDDTAYGTVECDTAWMWERDGHWAAGLRLNDLDGVDNWQHTTDATAFWIQDRALPVNITKIYATRVYNPNEVETAVGDVWRSSATYRVAYLDDAERTMARS